MQKDTARESDQSHIRKLIRATEVDTRMLGMIGALLFIWIIFDVFSDGRFLTPRNLWNLSVQTASVAVMATGMVLVIITRNIDLSVGSILGFVGMIMGVTQARLLPELLGFEHPMIWVIALLIGILIGAMIGALHGFIIAYLGVPAFIVTLGGLLVWRGAAWWVTSGQTVAPMDATFRLIGGGSAGSIGAFWSWVVGGLACLMILLMIWNGRRQRQRFNFPLRPVWAEFTVAGIGCSLVMLAVSVANAYPWPAGVVRRYAQANDLDISGGIPFISHGIAVPVLLAIAAGIAMTFLSTRTRFGRYVYAMGGNPKQLILLVLIPVGSQSRYSL